MSDRDWNINKGFGDVLTDLIVKVNDAAETGDIRTWFNSLRILYRNVAGHKKMSKDNIRKIDELLRDVKEKMESYENAITETQRAYYKKQISKVKDNLDEINIMLISEMHQAGLILPIYRKRAEFGVLET